jgi:enoyl-CoA hydratase/carnithine racemase
MLTGRKVEAIEAREAGIVDTLVEDGAALQRALVKAGEYLAIGPLALAATKSALARRPASLDLQAPLRMSQDHQDAIRAFLDKRPARFNGR